MQITTYGAAFSSQNIPDGTNSGDRLVWNGSGWVPTATTVELAVNYTKIADADFTTNNYDVATSLLGGGFNELIQVSLVSEDAHTITLPSVDVSYDGKGIGVSYQTGTAVLTIKDNGGSTVDVFKNSGQTATFIWDETNSEWVIRQASFDPSRRSISHVDESDFTANELTLSDSNLDGGVLEIDLSGDITSNPYTLKLPNSSSSNNEKFLTIKYTAGSVKLNVTTVGGTQLIGTIATQGFEKSDEAITVISDFTDTKYQVIQDSRINTTSVDIIAWNEVDELVTLQKYIDTYASSTGVGLENIVDNGNGTITVNNGEGWIRSTDSATGTLRPVKIPSITLTPTDEAISYVVAEYNGGTPRFVIGSDITTVSCRDRCTVAVIWRSGTTIKIMSYGNVSNDFGALYARREAATNWLKHGEGVIIGSPSLFYISFTSGSFYNGINRYATDAVDTSGTDTFDVWYRDGVGGWNVVTGQSQIIPAQYDDGTGTINTSTLGYRVTWWYYQIDTPTTLHAVMGQGTYANVAAAEAAKVPNTLPPWADKYGIGRLIGKSIHKAIGETTFTEFASPFEEVFVFSEPTEHNNLSGLNDGDFKHLTAAQYAIATQAASASVAGYVTAGTQTIAGVKTASGQWTFSGGVGIPFKLNGSGTGTANVNYIPFYESNGTTRQGYVGLASGANSTFFVNADVGGVIVNGASGVTINGNGTTGLTVNSSGDLGSTKTYANESATAANVAILSNGNFVRSVSSIKYKMNVEDLWESIANQFMEKARPIWYDSKSSIDPEGWHYLGFIAEELHEAGLPQLVFYKRLEDGTLEPDGVQYERVSVVLAKIAQMQAARIATLETQMAEVIREIKEINALIGSETTGLD